MKILVTGVAGFIGFHVAQHLLKRGDDIVGVDNMNDYYDPRLKEDRLKVLHLSEHFRFERRDISDRAGIASLFKQENFQRVVHLAAQAGVRYSLQEPHAYVDSNILGFLNVLEGCRHSEVHHLVYASSSSVYGANQALPFSVANNVDHPLSLYAATKKANELMAHCYSHLYRLPTTGLRFFTVYGPWGRPDMSPYLFAQAIMTGKPIRVFNQGRHRRDFTYVDDIVEGVVRCLDRTAQPNLNWNGLKPSASSSLAPWKIYNIGSNKPVELLTYIHLLETALGKTTEKELLPLQPGDMEETFADVSDLMLDIGYAPVTTIEQGIAQYATWFKAYYSKRAAI